MSVMLLDRTFKQRDEEDEEIYGDMLTEE